MRQTASMSSIPPVSRRVFLAMGVSAVIAACSDDASSTDASTATTIPSTTAAATTTEVTTTTVPPTTSTLPPVELSGDPFTLGVASGDPNVGSVVLWTRLAPDPLDGGGMPDSDIEVTWETSGDSDFSSLIASGVATATAEHGHAVHAIAQVDGPCYFRFRVGTYTSPVGSTRAAPQPDGDVSNATFAVANCQNYA